MKTIILAGGFGTRLSEYTDLIPKPMVRIGDRPIIWHIMEMFSNYGYKDFYVALGYKSAVVKEYFLKYHDISSDVTIDLKTGIVQKLHSDNVDWRVTLVDTGIETMTGGRVKRLQDYVGEEAFILTYGDGLANININELVNYHKSHKKMITMTAVRPNARFGELELSGDKVMSFKEKPQLHEGWINGGFFVINPEFFKLLSGDSEMLEREPMEKAVSMGEVRAFVHNDFWQCMDTKRDHQYLEDLMKSGSPPWKNEI